MESWGTYCWKIYIEYISGASEQNGVEVLSETSEEETKQKTLFTNVLKPKSSL